MSTTIKQSLVILIVLLVLSVGVAVFTLIQKQAADKQNEYLQGQVTDYQGKEQVMSKKLQDLQSEAQKLRADLDQSGREKGTLEKRSQDMQKDYDRLSADVEKVRREKNDVDDRMQTIRRERDDLMSQVTTLKNRPPEQKIVEKIVEKIVYKDRPVEQAPEQGEESAPPPVIQAPPSQIVVENKANEEYWAKVMRDKAALEIDLEKVKKELGDNKLRISDLTKSNSDLQVELGRLKNEKEDIVRKIKYGEDLADNLSIELARARNDQKMTSDRAEKVEQDNQALRSEIKQLTTTKVALEKSISRLTDDKNGIERKLVETENIIQNRIDEIWKIKKDIDTRFDARGLRSNEVELPPIVVNGGSGQSKAAAGAPALKKSGTIVSINEDNHFVIIDMGEKTGIKVGDGFKVYRNGGHIGSVEVIQVRQDISAADIKQKNTPFKPGDTVK